MSSVRVTRQCSPERRRLELLAPDSTRIVADVLRGNRREALLIIPGFWRTRDHPIMRSIAARFGETGLTVCTVDNRGHGESGGTFGFDTREAGDTNVVIETLFREGLLEQPPCILGFSAGGAIALSAAAERQDLFRGLVLVSPVADFKKVVPRPNPFRLNRQLSLRAAVRPPRFWWHEKSRSHPLDDATRVTAPVCLIHARNDWLVHHSHSEAIAARLPGAHELHVIDMDRAHAERMLDSDTRPWELMTAFMRRMLGMDMSGA